MTSKDIVEKWFLKELLDNNETAEYCYKMGSTYPIQEKDKEARERYEQVKKDLDRLEELEQKNEDLKEELELLKKKYYELKDMLSSGNL